MHDSETEVSISERGATAKGPPNSDDPYMDMMAYETREPVEDWEPSKHEKAIIYTLAILNLIVSLDATIIVTSLTVRQPLHTPASLGSQLIGILYRLLLAILAAQPLKRSGSAHHISL